MRSQINVGSPSMQNYSRFPTSQASVNTNANFGTPPSTLDKRRQIQASDLARIQSKTMYAILFMNFTFSQTSISIYFLK